MVAARVPAIVRGLRPAAVALAIGLPGCVGWASSSLPPRLTDAELQWIEGTRLPLTVGVVPHVHPAYSDALAERLRDLGLFDRDDPVGEFETPPDLLASVDRQIHGGAVIPLWTLLTFGLVPTFHEEERGTSFWLTAPGPDGARWHVDSSHTGCTTLGWVALLDVFDGDRTVLPFAPEHTQRMRDRLALEILEHADELNARVCDRSR